jgi:bifunctional DNA-binding transcriptional regulator/antitoxin component of YhaV-PrlF toxin-antitoxin module
MRFSKKVAARGNLTVPTDIRDALDIEDGDIVEMEIVGIVRKTTAVKAIGNSANFETRSISIPAEF